LAFFSFFFFAPRTPPQHLRGLGWGFDCFVGRLKVRLRCFESKKRGVSLFSFWVVFCLF
jgi:hypothetical protein